MAKWFKTVGLTSTVLALVGAFNWGLKYVFDFNLVEVLKFAWLINGAYFVIGFIAAPIAAIYVFTK